jgi:hypothetical protein
MTNWTLCSQLWPDSRPYRLNYLELSAQRNRRFRSLESAGRPDTSGKNELATTAIVGDIQANA